MEEKKLHIEKIRKEKFWIGVGQNPLSRSLRMAVKLLSTELYSKDVHFLMELIQNAEDNEYPDGVEPSLEFLITSQDITATGATATLLVFNNEKGFSQINMESICDVCDSTKAGNRKRGYIGEKGIGFKSVFLLTTHPYIFSNGYQIRFSETPCPECDIAYIVPEWVHKNPSVSDIHKLYGLKKRLPNTTLILPLKPEKVTPVKEQLSSLHPELLLFLSKIKRLSVKELNDDPSQNTIRTISISAERDFVSKKNIDAESYHVCLAAEDECRYYMWRQRFPVVKENMVEKRMDLEEWSITLAFPYGECLNRGTSSPGLYAFLPTETVTGFPFIIQADFLLPSSRETILWDNVWNQGILDCVPSAFINAFVYVLKTQENAPISTLASMFSFLPIAKSSHWKLNVIRESIREKLLQENIIPSENFSSQRIFHKPQEIGRVRRAFWEILLKAKKEGMKLHNLSSNGQHILHSSFDVSEYDNVLEFLGVKPVADEWYSKCIQSCNLVLGVGEDSYVEILRFVAENWTSLFEKTGMRSVPLLKYVSSSGDVSLLSVKNSFSLCRSKDPRCKSSRWMIEWSKQSGLAGNVVFLADEVQKKCYRMDGVLAWFRDYANVKALNVYDYALILRDSVKYNCKRVIEFAHFVLHSFNNSFLILPEVANLCAEMPLVDSCGGVSTKRNGVLVPANGSKWVELLGSANPWKHKDYVVLSDEYLHSGCYAGCYTKQNELVDFLKVHAGASDIPDIQPPNASFPTVYAPLTRENVILLLSWVKRLRSKGIVMPHEFKSCIAKGSWLRVTLSGCSGYRPPSQSFYPSSSWGSLLQIGSQMVDIPLIDQGFYGSVLSDYTEDLKVIGVMLEYSEACKFIGKHLMDLAAQFSLTKTKVIGMLGFIRYLRGECLSVDEIVNTVKKVKWVKTSCGDRFPGETIVFDETWKSPSTISNIPFLDLVYYGDDILEYKTELVLLGIITGFQQNYQIVLDNLKPSPSFYNLNPETFIFALECIRSSCSSDNLVRAMNGARCLQTKVGFMSPNGCYLLDPDWGCILQIFDGFPYIDSIVYGSKIFEYTKELKKIGVVVDLSVAAEAVSNTFKQLASTHSISHGIALSIISCYKKFSSSSFPTSLKDCIRDAKWLKTRLDNFLSPKECILYNPEWDAIEKITQLPFIDDSANCYGKSIHEYKDELKRMGVVTDLENGSKFVLSNISFPQCSSHITAESVVSLLQSVRTFNKQSSGSLPNAFLENISRKKWVKTTAGYMSPKESLLFDPKVKSRLQPCDAPFIDETFYGPGIFSYKSELGAVGVVVDMCCPDAKSLLSTYIKCLSEFAKIERLYNFLSQTDWRPDDGSYCQIWVPTGAAYGSWARPDECVLHDDENIFSSMLHVLDQSYKPDLLVFFSKAFGVPNRPSTDVYCKVWKEWEDSGREISDSECCAFWKHVVSSRCTEKVVVERVTKIPAISDGSNDLILVEKQNIFIPDDLLLRDLFEKSFFVWYPMKNIPSIPRTKLLDVYSKIGVRTISDSVTISDSKLDYREMKKGILKDAFIVKGLITLILGFLADQSMNIDTKQRYDSLKTLMNVSVFETPDPVSMSYSLTMSSGEMITTKTSQIVRWEREKSEFFYQKLDRTKGWKNVVEYATKFSEVVSQGLLWLEEDQIYTLSELIKLGFLVEFDENAVTYLMKSKNLQLFLEDEEFLSSAFPSSEP
ncbi:uncharacterized protein LOC130799868 [Amaranthus tricolor]|uniref:uncharacterized protein LOC130799868 n=1 Tax=Amaranthus tricolor TaxID=29722 RepID=UPI00258CA682|nr:uncharacterized protein LOC130799868 [Amaranthus tricolor]